MIEPGKYTAQLIEGRFGENKNGNDCMEIDFHIESEDADRTIYMYFTGGAEKITMENLKTLGFNGDFDDPEFEVTETEIECRYEEYKGRDKEKWNLPFSGGMKKSNSAAKRSAKWKQMFGNSTKIKPVTRDDAWDAFEEHKAKSDVQAEMVAQWETILAEFTDKDEHDMTGKDWSEFKKHLETPFA